MQHEQTLDALDFAGLTVGEVWLHYVNMGGDIGETEVDAYLHGMMPLPAGERNCVSQAVNELIDDAAGGHLSAGCRAPYSVNHSPIREALLPATKQDCSPQYEGRCSVRSENG